MGHELVQTVVRSSSLLGALGGLRVHILPAFGDLKVRLLHRAGIKAWALGLLDAKKSPGTVALLVSVLGTLLAAAVDDGIILSNPCAGITRALKLGKQKDAEKAEEIKAFTAVELEAVLGAVEQQNPAAFPLFLFLARTGVRLGEALGLRWEDLSLGEKPTVRIARTLSRGRVGTPKGGKPRTVSLSPQLAKVLKLLEVSRRVVALEHGKESVFTTSTGHTVSPSDVRRVLGRALVAAGVARHHSPHSFRHTFASLLLSKGESIQYVKEALGHSDIKLTVNAYGKWLPIQPTTGGVASLDAAPALPALAAVVAAEAPRPLLVAV